MLNLLRDKYFGKIIIGFVVLAFLVLVYFEWGKGGSFKQYEVARINGRSVFVQDLREYYEIIKSRYESQMNKDNSADIEKKIMSECLYAFIEQYILLQEAKNAKIEVSDDVIFQNIQRSKRFQTEDGKFNLAYYSSLPNAVKNKEEIRIADDIRMQFFRFRLMDIARSSDVNLRLFYQEKNTKVKIRFVIARLNKPVEQSEMDLLQSTDSERMKAEKSIDDVVLMAKKTGNFAGAATARGLSVFTTDFFGFFEPINKEGTTTRLNEIEFQDIYLNAFRLKPMQISDKIMINNAYVAIQVIAKQQPDMDKFYKERPALKNEFDNRLRNYVMRDWYMSVWQNYKIVNNLDNMYRSKKQ